MPKDYYKMLSIQTKEDKYFNTLEFFVENEKGGVFWVTQFINQNKRYASSHWYVNPAYTVKEHIEKIKSFKTLLETGNYQSSDRVWVGVKVCDSPIAISVEIDGDNEASKELNYAVAEEIKQKNGSDFICLRVGTPYGLIVLESLEPNKYILSVFSHTDISKDVAQLLADTAQNSAPVQEIQPIMKKVYSVT